MENLLTVIDRSPGNGAVGERYLLFTSFVTGAAVLVLEIVGARIISPHFGVSIVVWSALITVTLLSLAIGYWAGGLSADRSPGPERLYSFILAGAVFMLALPWLAPAVMRWAGSFGLRAGALLSATLLFGLPLALLGMVCPFIVKVLAGQADVVGRKTGLVYAVSTVGSFFGAVLTGFFLIPSFHVHSILFGTALLTGLTSAYPAIALRSRQRVALVCLFVVCCIVFAVLDGKTRRQRPNTIAQVQSSYGEIAVLDDGAKRTLLINGIGQGSMAMNNMPVERYFYFLDSLSLALNPEARKALVIGLGTGALPKLLAARGIRADAVEIDPAVAGVAQRYFGYREAGGALVLADARYFLDQGKGKYDAVFLDAYASEMVPYHLFSQEALQAVRAVLAADGLFAINLHDFRDPARCRMTRAIVSTLREVFPAVEVFEVQTWHDGAFVNLAILARNRGLSESDIEHLGQRGIQSPVSYMPQGQILTDGYNPIEWFNRPVSEAMRTASMRVFAN